MTETHATPTFPPGRYGHRREPRPRRRWLAATIAVLVVITALAISVRLYVQYGQPDYRPRVTRFYDITANGVTVEFEVHKEADKTATCRVRARSASGEEVGVALVDVPLGARPAITYRLPTSERPVTAEVTKCGPQARR